MSIEQDSHRMEAELQAENGSVAMEHKGEPRL